MKPLLLGMCNPLSDDPEYDLYPYPEGSAGYRLWKLLPEGTTREEYLRAFDRRNLLHTRVWDAVAARVAAQELLPGLDGRLVVVLGTQVRAALGLAPVEPLAVQRAIWSSACMFVWVAFPHPSGHNHWFHQPENHARAAALLKILLRMRCG